MEIRILETPPPPLFGLKKNTHFKAAMNNGNKWVTKSFVLIATPLSSLHALQHHQEDIGYGVVASKKVGNAVCRNKAKRRLRHIIRDHLPQKGHPHFIYLFIARHEILTYDFSQLSKDLQWALKRLHQQ